MTEPTAAQYEAAYHGIREEDGDGIYVCWDCATAEDRLEPVRDNAAAGEVCGRCTDVGWEYDEDAIALSDKEAPDA